MADQSLPQKTRLTNEPSGSSLIHVTDVTDTTDGATGTDKACKKDIFLASVPSYPDIVQGNAVLKGGIIHTSLLIYTVWARRWIINNDVGFGNLSESKTLSAAHATLDRFDSFVVRDTAGVFSIEVLEGTPANPALIPVPDFTTEAVIGTVLVEANTTVDGNVVTEVVYNEDLGETVEWDISDTITGQNLSNATSPYLGTVSASFPAVATTDVVSWIKDALYTINPDLKVNFALKVPGLLASTSRIQIKLINQTSGNYWLFTLKAQNAGNYGFDNTNTGWQLVSIPIGDFQTTSRTQTQADKIEITFAKTPILWLDWINTQSGIPQPVDTIQHPLKSIKISLTAAQIKTIGSVPIDAIQAPGIGKMINIVRTAAVLKWGSVAFDNNPLNLKVDGGVTIWTLTPFLSATANSKKIFKGAANGTTSSELAENTKWILTGTDSAATGDSTIDVYINYEIIEL